MADSSNLLVQMKGVEHVFDFHGSLDDVDFNYQGLPIFSEKLDLESKMMINQHQRIEVNDIDLFNAGITCSLDDMDEILVDGIKMKFLHRDPTSCKSILIME